MSNILKQPDPGFVKKLQALPSLPGVYLFKDSGGKILYIGKAADLKRRVSSYFQNRIRGPKIGVMVAKCRDVETVETRSEVDALLLEAHLIHTYTPAYNTLMKDDKTYPLLKITGDRFPRLVITRKRDERKAIYPDTRKNNSVVKQKLGKGAKSVIGDEYGSREKASNGVYYGPYTDAKLLKEAVRIINGLFPIRKCRTLPKRACLYYHIGQCLAPCIMPEVKPEYDKFVREVKDFLQGGKKSLMDYLTERMKEAAREYKFEDAQFFKEQIEALGWFRKKRFHLTKPEQGIGLRGTLELKRVLGLQRLPEKIVCFDVSNIQGDKAVASKVCFYRELSSPVEYRHYRIKDVAGIDDYAMIREAVRRMLAGVMDGRESGFPDLILIDGGRGHLNTALKVLKEQNCEGVEVISIAKKFEFVFAPGKTEPLVLPPSSSALRLLQKIRDEAHRFAITYHRKLKERELSKSVLDQIDGIGGKRKIMLLKSFQSIDELRQTPVDILARMPGMNPAVAEKVHDFLKCPGINKGVRGRI